MAEEEGRYIEARRGVLSLLGTETTHLLLMTYPEL